MPDYREKSLRDTTLGGYGTPALLYRDDNGGDGAGTDQFWVAPQANDVGAMRIDPETRRTTYRAAIIGLVSASGATDLAQIIGSSTTIVFVKRIRITGKAGTAVGVPVTIEKRSTANSGGTATTPTPIPGDSGPAVAATSVVSFYTANPTTGTAVGLVDAAELFLPVTTGVGQGLDFDYSRSPIALRGVAQALAIKFNTISVSSPLINVMIEFDERPSTA